MKPVHFLKLSVIGGMLIAGSSNAQMVGYNVFMKGKYLELGISKAGNFGTDSVAPAGYHAHMYGPVGTPSVLGFVTDEAMDGWTVGTPPMIGDYFLPGYPYEGWTLEVDGGTFHAGQVAGYSSSCTCAGSNISYTTSGTHVTSTWQGMVDSIQLTQVTTLDTNSLYFVVKVTLVNMAVAPKDNVFYSRDMDPDNESTWGGTSITKNKIEHQMPGSFGASVVSATGSLQPSMSYMAVGCTDTASRVMVIPTLYLTSAPSMVYTGASGAVTLFAEGDSNSMDQGIAVVMRIGHLATVDSAGDSVYRTTAASTLHPANSKSFSYFYAFSRPAVDSAIAYINSEGAPAPSPGTLGVKNVNSVTAINVYPNPGRDLVNVTNLSSTDHVSLVNIMGRDAGVNWSVKTNGTNTFYYNSVPTGMYMLMVTDADGNVKARVRITKQ